MSNINSDPRMDGANFEVLMTSTMTIRDYDLNTIENTIYLFQN